MSSPISQTALRLDAAIYRHTAAQPGLVSRGPAAAMQTLGALIGTQIETALGDIPAQEVGVNMVVSTMLDMPFTSGWMNWGEVGAEAACYTRSPPQNFICGYECASWGYVLRYAHQLAQTEPYVVVSICDTNLFDLSYWRESPHWGHSGFGVATIVIRRGEAGTVQCRMSKSANAFGEFCLDLRNLMASDESILVSPPYFPSSIAVLYDRLLPVDRLLLNRHAQYGHSFGADPWIALIEQRLERRDRAGDRYLATSIALSGYWCLAELSLHPEGRFLIQDAHGLPIGGHA
ncbi:hypothetical protein ACT2FY_00725 [Paraburkholderia fungorum]|uniref:hypothetical protein n=1 Tax=Paraburkholderia fungorum TaxID=134537 RepID=UPI00402B2604